MQITLRTLLRLLSALALPLCSSYAGAQIQRDPLAASFVAPPDAARPRVWWHWMNGNVTQAGIKQDLEWMHRVGIAGVQNFDASLGTPKLVSDPLLFMTPAWKEAFRYTVTLADQLGLEVAIAGSPGWSESGGPWVRPEQAMKKLVWSEAVISGGRPFVGVLPAPPAVVGPFQDVRMNWDTLLSGGKPANAVPDLYRDVATVAYRLPETDRSSAELHPSVTSSGGPVDSRLLWDGGYAKAVALAIPQDGAPAWIQLDYGRRQTIQSVTLAVQGNAGLEFLIDRGNLAAELQSSGDGQHFDSVVKIYETANTAQTLTFAPVTARYFRLSLPPPRSIQLPPFLGLPPIPPRTEHLVAEFVLSAAPRVNHFEEKAAFFVDTGLSENPTPHSSAADVIKRDDIVDLTSRMGSDGALKWSPPAGRWQVLRIGYSLLGVTNHPASPAATGLEVDKLSRSDVKSDMDDYLSRYEETLGPLMGKRGLHAMVNDSWEAGAQNWTAALPEEFKKRRGYELRLWLPALTGRVIGSAEATDQFLWDFRRTLGELLTDYHYGQIASSLHERGMIHYGESHESGRAFIGDGMDVKRDDDIPMGAMWVSGFSPQQQYDADIRESASVAHIYGQNLVAAESMTAIGLPGKADAFAPQDLKPTVDRELIDGLNRFVVHTSVHQPLDQEGPGVTLGPFGQWFTRHETWAEQAAPWVTYLSRSAYLLQQGHFVADVLYYYGQDSNITALYAKQLPPVPEGYAFDFANAHALTMLSVQDGRLITASGMNYRLLALDPRAGIMSMDVLQRISQLVMAGATVVGDKPQNTPSLVDDAVQFHSLADQVWGTDDSSDHAYGQGRVIAHRTLSEVLSALKLAPDFAYTKSVDSSVWFVHRRLADGDVYFVSNRQARAERVDATFRVEGKAPEIWRADSGKIEPASYRIENHQSTLTLNLVADDAVFVVFRKDTQQLQRQIPQPIRQPLASVAGPWTLRFQPSRGAPDSVVWPTLKAWNSDPMPGIKYFSGTASYETSLQVASSWLQKGHRIELDLGVVKSIAEVLVNGKSAAIVWKSPFSVDVTDLVRPGKNALTIRVTNLWPNRLIGDQQPNAVQVISTTYNPYSADFPLLDSGLLGPVSVVGVTL